MSTVSPSLLCDLVAAAVRGATEGNADRWNAAAVAAAAIRTASDIGAAHGNATSQSMQKTSPAVADAPVPSLKPKRPHRRRRCNPNAEASCSEALIEAAPVTPPVAAVNTVSRTPSPKPGNRRHRSHVGAQHVDTNGNGGISDTEPPKEHSLDKMPKAVGTCTSAMSGAGAPKEHNTMPNAVGTCTGAVSGAEVPKEHSLDTMPNAVGTCSGAMSGAEAPQEHRLDTMPNAAGTCTGTMSGAEAPKEHSLDTTPHAVGTCSGAMSGAEAPKEHSLDTLPHSVGTCIGAMSSAEAPKENGLDTTPNAVGTCIGAMSSAEAPREHSLDTMPHSAMSSAEAPKENGLDTTPNAVGTCSGAMSSAEAPKEHGLDTMPHSVGTCIGAMSGAVALNEHSLDTKPKAAGTCSGTMSRAEAPKEHSLDTMPNAAGTCTGTMSGAEVPKVLQSADVTSLLGNDLYSLAQNVDDFCPIIFGDGENCPGFLTEVESTAVFWLSTDFAEMGGLLVDAQGVRQVAKSIQVSQQLPQQQSSEYPVTAGIGNDSIKCSYSKTGIDMIHDGTCSRCSDCGHEFTFYQDDCLCCPCGGLVCPTCVEKYGSCRGCRGKGEDPRFKTRLCKYFAAGACQFGGKCHFAHGMRELRRAPNASSKGHASTGVGGPVFRSHSPSLGSACRNYMGDYTDFDEIDEVGSYDDEWAWDPAEDL